MTAKFLEKIIADFDRWSIGLLATILETGGSVTMEIPRFQSPDRVVHKLAELGLASELLPDIRSGIPFRICVKHPARKVALDYCKTLDQNARAKLETSTLPQADKDALLARLDAFLQKLEAQGETH